jgi:hypothetical protein
VERFNATVSESISGVIAIDVWLACEMEYMRESEMDTKYAIAFGVGSF